MYDYCIIEINLILIYPSTTNDRDVFLLVEIHIEIQYVFITCKQTITVYRSIYTLFADDRMGRVFYSYFIGKTYSKLH